MKAPYRFARCRILPLPDHQVEVRIDDRPVTRWHFGPSYPRPFFYPLAGPSGESLTRMGHPGAPNHDHHRSVWFAHQKLLGIDFWSDGTRARIVQRQWLAFEEGDEEARLGFLLEWHDGHDAEPLLQQTLLVAVIPGQDGHWQLELQSEFKPQAEMIEFGQSHYGLLAVRVAKSLSAHFGGGVIRDSHGRLGEAEIFGQSTAWVDYSGPIRGGESGESVAGITYFDHPINPAYPGKWHVREDGWMGVSLTRDEPLLVTRQAPLQVRYLLDVHPGALDPDLAARRAHDFARRPPLVQRSSPGAHRQYGIDRAAD